MRLTLKAFRCHLDATFEFEDNKIHLLKGNSGTGKSTVLWSIYWCLYGGLNHLANHAHPSKKTSVCLEFAHVKITRSKRPERLLVETATHTLEDDPAQAWIEDHFGKRFAWMCSSYLAQSERHWLLERSQNDKLELIQAFSFDKENPDSITQALDASYQDSLKDYERVKNEHEREESRINEQTDPSIKELVRLSPSQRERLCLEIETLTEQLATLQRERIVQSERARQLALWRSELETLQGSESVPIPSSEETESWREELARVEAELSILPSYESRESLRQQLATVRTKRDTLIRALGTEALEPLHASEYAKTVKEQETRAQYVAVCKKFGIEYTRDAIDAKVSEYQRVLEGQKEVERWNERQRLVAQIEALPRFAQPMELAELEALQKKKMEMEQYTNVMDCPNCETHLRLKAGKLELCGHSQVSQDDILSVGVQIRKWQELYKQYQSKTALESQLVAYKEVKEPAGIPSLNASQRTEMSRAVDFLQKIVLIDEVPLEQMERRMSWTKQKTELDQTRSLETMLVEQERALPLNLPESVRPRSVLQSERDALKRRILSAEQAVKEAQRRILRKEQLEKQIAETTLDETLDGRIETVSSLLTSKRSEEEKQCARDSYERAVEALKTRRGEVEALYKTMSLYFQLKQISKEVESEVLQDTVETINNSMGDILTTLFDAPISVRLATFKTIKSSKTVKPQIHLEIQYKGAECDITQLSGGEIDRVSLAILLSFARLSTSPVILLDECLVSLDANLKSLCIDILRQQTDKTILCVLHDAVEGEYDETLTLKG